MQLVCLLQRKRKGSLSLQRDGKRDMPQLKRGKARWAPTTVTAPAVRLAHACSLTAWSKTI
eukprot:5240398-Pyramimonas_sp.AAC.2